MLISYSFDLNLFISYIGEEELWQTDMLFSDFELESNNLVWGSIIIFGVFNLTWSLSILSWQLVTL